MTQKQVRQTVVVLNPQGIHARPADLLANAANRFESEISILKDGELVDAKSILSIMTLAAEHGTELELIAAGSDADLAIAALADLFARQFELNGPSNGDSTDPSRGPYPEENPA